MFTVAEIMTREPYTLGPDNTLEDARQMMTDYHIRHIPIVTDAGTLIGLISQRDVISAEGSNVLNAADNGGTFDRYVAASTIMTTPVKTTQESTGLRSTALYLQKHKLGCLPVLNNGRLSGIITDSDFVGVAINLMEQLEYSEPGEPLYDDD
jgi:CBS domain-containing membrane protein